MIKEPGVWELAAEEYHADPCPEPSLNNSLIKPLLLAPAKARWAHPRLNPQYQPKESSRLDLGSVAHKLLLGRGRGIKVLDFPDWRTNAAKQARDEARALGQIPILEKDFEIAEAMFQTAGKQLSDAGLLRAFTDVGSSEISLLWRDGAGCWGRNMIDWLDSNNWEIWDYKTTDRSARPEDASLGAHVVEMGYDTQCAMQERGLVTLFPDLAGRIKFRLLFQETEPPYLISIVEPDEATMTIARKKVDYAFNEFSRCLKSGVWPGYATGVVPLRHADYLANRWLEREIIKSVDDVVMAPPPPAQPAQPKRIRKDGFPDRREHNKGGRPQGSKNLTRTERVRLAQERERKARERQLIGEPAPGSDGTGSGGGGESE